MEVVVDQRIFNVYDELSYSLDKWVDQSVQVQKMFEQMMKTEKESVNKVLYMSQLHKRDRRVDTFKAATCY